MSATLLTYDRILKRAWLGVILGPDWEAKARQRAISRWQQTGALPYQERDIDQPLRRSLA